MFSFFKPRWINESKDALKHARKIFRYKCDLLSDEQSSAFQNGMDALDEAIKQRDKAAAETAVSDLEKQCGKFMPPTSELWIRENAEVFLVAIIIALGVRTYFLQPFTIPTGSMQPTLNGIIAYDTGKPAPDLMKRAMDAALFGRSYIDVVAKQDEQPVGMREVKKFLFFTYTEMKFSSGEIVSVPSSIDPFMRGFGFDDGKPHIYHAGDVIARGYVDTGSHVFVNKVGYNFYKPKRGDVFVFTTVGLPTLEKLANPNATSEYYIKRLAGLPGDTLRIDSPKLFVNGKLAQAWGFRQVMSQENGYRGYSNWGGDSRFRFLRTPDDSLQIPDEHYFAMGDNSYNSADSRFFGFVPAQNITGDAVFVYWPFGKHWGLIH